jgi:hypothetical protein
MEISQMTNKRILGRLLIIITLAAMVVLLASCDNKETGGDKGTDTKKPAEGTTAAPVADAKIPLPVELPPVIIEGTPPNLSNEKNLEEMVTTARPPFYVPAGTTNVALNKPITGTDDEPIGGTLSMIVDGDMKGSDGSWLELGLFAQSVTIDLEAPHEISAILLWHYHKQQRVYYAVVVQTADDADFVTNVTTLFNNDIENIHSLGVGTDKNYVEKAEGKLVDGKGTIARYVRFYSSGNNEDDMNHYIEAAVYGKPVK